VQNPDKRVAYFHGCYSNYNTPEVGKAMVRVYEHFGYEVMVPPQKCSGTPMFANGMLKDARRHAETNVENLVEAIGEGADVIASCTSCSLSLRQEYPELFDIHGIEDVSDHTYEALEYLRINEDLEGELAGHEARGRAVVRLPRPVSRTQSGGLSRQAVETFRDVDGVTPWRTWATPVRVFPAPTAGRKRSTRRRWRSARRCSSTWRTPRATWE